MTSRGTKGQKKGGSISAINVSATDRSRNEEMIRSGSVDTTGKQGYGILKPFGKRIACEIAPSTVGAITGNTSQNTGVSDENGIARISRR